MNIPFNQSRWDLQQLLAVPVEESLEGHLAELESVVQTLELSRPLLTPEIEQEVFLHLLHRYEEVSGLSRRLSGFANLWVAEDTQNPVALNMRGRVEQVLTQAGNRILFFNLWFKSLPHADAQRLIEGSGDFRYFLESLRRFQPYTLSESEEKVINLKDVNGIEALINIYDMITNRFSFNLEVDGEQKTLTRDQLNTFYRSSSPEIREAAFAELYRVYIENSTLLAQIYNHRVRDWYAEGLDLRHYATPIAARNIGNDLPDQVVETLLAVCRKNNGLFQRYFKLKADWLKMDKLRRCDIYAPLARSEKTYAFPQAAELVLSSFQDFSPQVADHARRVFSEQHLDSEVRPGKRGGAFCYSTLPQLAPWVLVNYSGKPRDVATLAHELGHAVHALMAAEHSLLTFHSALPMAETASVFAEMLLTERLLKEENDQAVRRDLLVSAIDDAYATVQRQAYFTLFEKEAHRLVNEGLTFDELCEAYLANLEEQFGDAVEVNPEFKWEWIAVPHFYHAPFYTYAYSFGQLLVLALFAQYKAEGESFIPRYLKILSYGGSKAPAEILAEAGLAVDSAEFWQGGYDVLKGMLRELELIQEKEHLL